jgi:hypothetical protein
VVLRAAVVVASLITLAAPARADITQVLPGGAKVDWSKGVVTVVGVGLADRHAPTPAVARSGARRRADDDARAKLTGALAEVPWIDAGAAKQLATREGWLAAHAIGIDASLNPDGSWRVTMGLPIEAIRAGLIGPRTLPAKGDAPGPAIIIDATAIDGLAAVGGVGIGERARASATLWMEREPPEALVGERPAHRVATAFANGVLEVGTDPLEVHGRLIVVVVRRP